MLSLYVFQLSIYILCRSTHNIYQWICKFVSKRPVNQTRTGEKKYIFLFFPEPSSRVENLYAQHKKFSWIVFWFFYDFVFGRFQSVRKFKDSHLKYVLFSINWSVVVLKQFVKKKEKKNHTETGLTVSNKCRCMTEYHHNNGSTLSGKINLWHVSLDVRSSEWFLW